MLVYFLPVLLALCFGMMSLEFFFRKLGKENLANIAKLILDFSLVITIGYIFLLGVVVAVKMYI